MSDRLLTTTVTAKGQFTVPKAMRDALGIAPGDRLTLSVDLARGVLVLTPIRGSIVAETAGSLKRHVRRHRRTRRGMLSGCTVGGGVAGGNKDGGMPYKAKTSPVIRATLAAMRAVDELRDARLAAAADATERERVQAEYWDVMKPLLAILHEAQFGPLPPPQTGLRLLPRAADATTTAANRRSAPGTVYQLKVTLRGSSPPIWRRLQVPGTVSLARLHTILQVAMGWTDSHLHEFVIRETRYGFADMEWDPLERPKDERRVRLGQRVTAEGDRFAYEYDFGDGWAHEIVVEKMLPADPGIRYPRCTGGKRACPPEDVGGLSGYADFLAAIRDPRHAEHADLLAWAGGAFDPDAFDMDAINTRLYAGR